MESFYVETPGLRIHCLTDGRRGGERPVVLLHGFGSTSREFRHQIPVLAERGHPTYAMDTRGFGKTEKPRIRITRAMLADDVVRFCESLDLRDVVLIGRDWGALIAFKAAIDNQAVFSGLVLIDSGCTVIPPDANHLYWYKAAPLPEAFLASHVRDLIEVRFAGKDATVLGTAPGNPYDYPTGKRPKPAWLTDEDIAHYVESFDADSQHAAIQYYRYAMPLHRVVADPGSPRGERYEALSEQEVAAMWLESSHIGASPRTEYLDFGPEDRYKKYRNPALLIYGNRMGNRFIGHGNEVVPSGDPYADQFTRYFPSFQAYYIDCGHNVPEEEPDLMTAALLAFIQQLSK